MSRFIHYQTVEQVSFAVRNSVERAAGAACARHAWPVCSPIWFYPWPPGVPLAVTSGESELGDGPPPMDLLPSTLPALPVGELPDLIAVLTELSKQWGLTWELRRELEGPLVGRIEDGCCDTGVFELLGAEVAPEVVEDVPKDWRQMRLADTLVDVFGNDLSRIGIQLSEVDGPSPTIRIRDAEVVDTEVVDDNEFDGPQILRFPTP